MSKSLTIDYGENILRALNLTPEEFMNLTPEEFTNLTPEEFTNLTPEEFTNLTPEEFSQEERMRIAVTLYQLGQLSTGAAAEFATVPKPLFSTKLAEYGVNTFNLLEEELQNDLLSASCHL